jgi:hypothetical protein
VDDKRLDHKGRQGACRAAIHEGDIERLLKNLLYVGQVSHQDEVYVGEQEAIVERAVWERANVGLAKERNSSGAASQSPPEPKIETHRTLLGAPERTERVPRITRLLALALKFEELIRSGAVNNYAALARVGQVSRSRLTQMANLLNLAPDIQEEILFLRPEEAQKFRVSEPSLRKLTAILLWSQQREQWRNLRRPARNGHAESEDSASEA